MRLRLIEPLQPLLDARRIGIWSTLTSPPPAVKPPPPIKITCVTLFWCAILFRARYYFDQPHSRSFFVMTDAPNVPFLADGIGVRHHDELVIEHVFEGVTDEEVSDAEEYSTGDDADSDVENAALLKSLIMKVLIMKLLILKLMVLKLRRAKCMRDIISVR